MTHKFDLGEKVYIMHENSIVKTIVKEISIGEGKNIFYIVEGFKTKYIEEEVFNTIESLQDDLEKNMTSWEQYNPKNIALDKISGGLSLIKKLNKK